jgi:hypothetical protein
MLARIVVEIRAADIAVESWNRSGTMVLEYRDVFYADNAHRFPIAPDYYGTRVRTRVPVATMVAYHGTNGTNGTMVPWYVHVYVLEYHGTKWYTCTYTCTRSSTSKVHPPTF